MIIVERVKKRVQGQNGCGLMRRYGRETRPQGNTWNHGKPGKVLGLYKWLFPGLEKSLKRITSF